MKFKLDENLPFILNKLIESQGDHQVDSVFHEKLSGSDDKTLLSHCKKEKSDYISDISSNNEVNEQKERKEFKHSISLYRVASD